MIRWLTILFHLTKLRIALFAAFSTAAGFTLARQGLSGAIFLSVLSVFLLACGSCALNQYQERETDRLMKRTRGRPLPAGELRPSTVLKISFGVMVPGLLILLVGTNAKALGLGLAAMILYNGIYTPLKRRTAFAAVPGALIGAIPPLLGWISEGNHPPGPQILAVAFFFFIWQIPHFWILFLHDAGEYERAGFPALTRIFSPVQIRRIAFMWLSGAAVTCLLMPLFGVKTSYPVYGGLFAAGCWLVWKGSGLLRPGLTRFSLQTAFNSINIYAFLVVSLLILGCLSA